MSNMSGPEEARGAEKAEITPRVEGQLSVLTAVVDRINNTIAVPVANSQLREMRVPDIPTLAEDMRFFLHEFKKLRQNLTAAAVRVARGESLQEIPGLGGHPMIDLVYTDYTDLSQPPRPVNPQTSTSERK